jgi:hypothetical protein
LLASARSIKPPGWLREGGGYNHYLSIIAQELQLQQEGNSAGLSYVASTEARPFAQQAGLTGCVSFSP